MTKAIVYDGSSSTVQEIDVAAPLAGEVKVKLTASGVCHTDLSVMNGSLPMATPVVPGHEAAGIVTEVGPGVASLVVGDHVALACMPQCHECYYCVRGQWPLCELQNAIPAALRYAVQLDGTSRFSHEGHEVYQFCFLGSFAEETVVPELAAIKVPDSFPLELASIVGCSVVVGLGAARRIASIRDGDTVVILGCGGVGLNAVQGARLAGAGTIVAVDLVAASAERAKIFGATHTVCSADEDAAAIVAELTQGRGADVTIEMVGLPETVKAAIALTRPGGEVVLVGLGAPVELDLATDVLLTGKTLKGCMYGSTNARADFAEVAALYASGELLLDELVSERYDLDSAHLAFDPQHSGAGARPLIVYGQPAANGS